MTRKQRRRAWGSITEAKRGKKNILRWQENTPCGRKRKTKTVYGTYREACTKLDRIHVERADDKPVPTITQAYGTRLEPTMAAQVAAGTLAPNTRSLVTRSWANYVSPTWGSMPVDQLRPVHLQEWLLALPAATADTALLTLRKIYGTVSGFVVLPIDPFAATVCRHREIHHAHAQDARALQAPVHASRIQGHPGASARDLARGAVHHGVLLIVSLGRVAGHPHR